MMLGFLAIMANFVIQVHAQPSFVTNGLVAYYPFSGNADDASGNGLNGTNNGATLTADRFGKPASAYSFDGSTSFISIDSSPLLQLSTNLTISFWMNSASGGMMICKGNEECAYSVGGSVSSGIGFNHQNINNMVFSKSPLPSNMWFQVVCTLNSTDARIYINGQLNNSGTGETLGTGTGALTIGKINSGLPSYYQGSLDDLRIYNCALSADEVQQLYLFEAPPIINIQTAVYFDSSNLRVGTNYQVQASSDLSTWSNFGPVFTATNTYWRETNYWDVTNANRLFFRLQVSP
jgi:hypothetical protein